MLSIITGWSGTIAVNLAISYRNIEKQWGQLVILFKKKKKKKKKKNMNLAISNVLPYLDSYLKFLVWRIEEQSIV